MTCSTNPPIPTLPGLPVLGNFQDLTGDVRIALTKAYKQHGPVFRMTSLGREIIVLAGVEANKFASKNDGKVWRTWESWRVLNPPFDIEKSILSLDGEAHREIRKALRRSLGRKYLDQHMNRAYQVVIEDIQKLERGQTFSVTHWSQALVMEQLSQLAVHSTSRPFFNDMLHFFRTIMMVNVRSSWPTIMFKTPKYLWAKKSVFSLTDALIAHHRRNPPGEHRMADMIDDLLEAQQQNPDFWSYNDVRAGTLVAFTAGLDTAASMLSFTLYRLHKHPEILQRVKEEVDELFAQGQGFPSLDHLGKAPALHNTVLETLRLHPIAPALTRFSTQDFEFAGYTIPKNKTLVIGTTVAHGLDDVYSDPECFDPDRFGPQRAEHRKAGVFHPFGLGAHTCLGSGLAEYLLLINVATIVHCLDLHLDPQYELTVTQQPAPHPESNFQLWMSGTRHSLNHGL